MKASREIRNWVSRLRRRFAGRNGVIPGFAFDNPDMKRKRANSKRIKDCKP